MLPATTRIGKIQLVLCLFLSLLFFSGCRNYGTHTFAHRHRVRDSLALCDIHFYARLSYKLETKNLPVEIETITPDGITYMDTVNFPTYVPGASEQRAKIQKEGMWRDVVSSYRSSVRFPEEGVWLFRLTPLFEDKNKASWVKEMGVVVLPSDNGN